MSYKPKKHRLHRLGKGIFTLKIEGLDFLFEKGHRLYPWTCTNIPLALLSDR